MKKKQMSKKEAKEKIKHYEEMINMQATLKKSENDKTSTEEIIEFKPGEMKFKGVFQTFIDSLEARYSLTDFLLKDKEIDHYKLKKIVLIFSNKKGAVQRMTIEEGEATITEEKNLTDELTEKLIEKNVKELLESLAVKAMWLPSFGWYEKTGEKELTLKVRIYQQSVDTDECLEKVVEILKSMGWTYKIADDVKDAGRVSKSKEKK